MRDWWGSLNREQRNWFIMVGLLVLFVVSMLTGIVGAVNWYTLEPLVHLGFGTAIASAVTSFITAMVRFT